MGNGPFIDVLPIKKVIFHGYVKFPDGNTKHRLHSGND